MTLSKAEIAERNKLRCKARYDWLKANGYCVRCGREKAEKGRVTCMTCNAAANDRNRLYMLKYNREHKEEIKARNIAYRKRLREEGRCVQCGRPSNGFVLCQQCRNKSNNRGRSKRLGNQMRDELGICRKCNSPVVPGFKHCQYHLDLLAKARKKALQGRSLQEGWHKHKMFFAT